MQTQFTREPAQIIMPRPKALLRVEDVVQRTTLPVSEIRRQVAAGKFPKPVHPSPRTSAWIEEEVEAWIANLERHRDAEAKGQSNA